jgi:hypothetical protein
MLLQTKKSNLICLEYDVGAAPFPVDYPAQEPLDQNVGKVLPAGPGHLKILFIGKA